MHSFFSNPDAFLMLYDCSIVGDTDGIKYAIKNGARPDCGIFYPACHSQFVDTPLHALASFPDAQHARALSTVFECTSSMKLNLNVKVNGQTPLDIAMTFNNSIIIDILTSHGARTSNQLRR